MEIPANVYATLAACVDKFPHAGSDDDRRAAMEKAVATLRARHGLRWVWKTEHQSLIAPSKDGLGYVPEGEIEHGRLTTMFIWDTINGGSRKLNAAPLVSEEARPAYVLAVTPKDWLASEPAPPVVTPPAQPPAEPGYLPPYIAALDALTAALGALVAKVDGLERTVAALEAKPAQAYELRTFGRLISTFEPRK